MNLLLFIIMITVSFIVVRIGAIAFELTGLEWSLAKFQSLSCFTGTGFTTREAELITGNPQRRRIASVLMVFGNAGLVTLIATFANSLRPDVIKANFTIPFLRLIVPTNLLPFVNLLTIVIFLYVAYKFLTRSKAAKKITESLRTQILKRDIIRPVSFEELLVATGGYGVSTIDVCPDSPVLNKTLREAELTNRDILLLAIEREEEIIPTPRADTKILLGDRLMCFGKLDTIKKEICIVPDLQKTKRA